MTFLNVSEIFQQNEQKQKNEHRVICKTLQIIDLMTNNIYTYIYFSKKIFLATCEFKNNYLR